MLPTATMAGGRRPGPRPELRGSLGAGHLVDRALLTLCLLASLLLLYRCLAVTGGLLPGAGAGVAAAAAGATVISTTTTVRGGGDGATAAASGVVTELVVDRFGQARSTTVTRSEGGTTITVTGSAEGAGAALRARRGTLRGGGGSGGSTARRSGRAAIAAAAAARARGRQHGPRAFPGLPADFDAQVGAGRAALARVVPCCPPALHARNAQHARLPRMLRCCACLPPGGPAKRVSPPAGGGGRVSPAPTVLE